MENIEINPSLFLTISAKENIKKLQKTNLPFIIEKDPIKNIKSVRFQTTLFDSDEVVSVSFPYDPASRLFGVNYIELITLEEAKSNNYSDGSFNRIEQIIERKYGVPEFCNGTLEYLIFKIGSLELIHAITEIRMGWNRHVITIQKAQKTLFRPSKYADVVSMYNFILECMPKNMIISHFSILREIPIFMIQNETKGYYGKQNGRKYEIIPFAITKELVEFNRTMVSRKPIIEHSKEIEPTSLVDIKMFIHDYFLEQNQEIK